MKRTDQGFTLVELMVVVAISAIALAMAIPAFTTLIQHNQADGVASDLVAAMNLAREEAIRTRGVAAVCPRAAARTGEPYCASNGDYWTNGWLVLALPTGAVTTCPTDSSTSVIRAYEAPDPTGSRIIISNNGATSVRNCLRFGATGLPAGNFNGLTFTVAFPGNNAVTCMVMSSAGRLRRHDATGRSC